MTDAPPPPPPPQPGAAPPGWYPTSPGYQQYWDGMQWTNNVAPLAPAGAGDDKTWAVLMHLSVFILGFIGPLAVHLVKRHESPFLRAHSADALNFQITVLIAGIISFILLIVIIGFFLMLLLVLVWFVYPIVGAVAAGRGQYPSFPVLRLIT